mmetsp:Transcript_17170/g.32577  ORF Transcript_17170/g.32577 Transcript_17170/m.32577 type:complete len:576 (+) Transcript_17170:139-1866(+)
MGLGPSIDPEEVGLTGLIWLLLSYGYVLYEASNLISEGSELLLLIPSMAGLVGGVVLPLLGAVPDGAIILFSGLGSIETAQETLSVGVGALAGSTIMLLTIPFFLSIYGGRVNLTTDATSGKQTGNYMGRPKLSPQGTVAQEFHHTGVTITQKVQTGGWVMMCTTLPYLLIQGPAWLLHGPEETIAAGEHVWSAIGFAVCMVGLLGYLHLQLRMSTQSEDQDKRMAILKRQLKKGAVSLSGAVAAQLKQKEQNLADAAAQEYQQSSTGGGGGVGSTEKTSLVSSPKNYPSPAVAEYLKELLADAFHSYDTDRNGSLDRNEVYVFFRDFNEAISEQEMDKLFMQVDKDKSGYVDLDEFIGVAYMLIKVQDQRSDAAMLTDTESGDLKTAMADTAFNESEEEEETVPEEFTSLSPDQQQAAIKKKAFMMLAAGTILVVLFSDPMVDVMGAVAKRANLPPFYVSFVLAPVASNASEIISSMYYASKKTRKTMTVSLTTLEGAAAVNNTFCLSIFMGLIFFRGLAWQYSAETVTIILTQLFVGGMVQRNTMTLGAGLFILAIFPLSIAMVATLEALGFD